MVIQDNYNVRGSRGLSDFDARHRFVFSGIYELPFHGNQLVEGWQLSYDRTVAEWQSGEHRGQQRGASRVLTTLSGRM